MKCFLPSKSVLWPRICSLINLFVLGAFNACLMPTEFWSKCPGPLLGTCEQQYTCNIRVDSVNTTFVCGGFGGWSGVG